MKANGLNLLFPTLIYRGSLKNSATFNKDLKKEINALSEIDLAGRKWSKRKYIGGYSSYSSLANLHLTSPNFGDLRNRLRPHVTKFVRALQWDLMDRKVEMTTCWANKMGFATHHTLHIHPLSVISGVYFVDAPPGSSELKIEDPRIDRLMASPPRLAKASPDVQNYISIKPIPGSFVLFESWLRHEVPPHHGQRPRVSISFNYEWVY